MQAVNNSSVDVKLVIKVPGTGSPEGKRISDQIDYQGLISKAKALAEKHNVLDDQEPVITYKAQNERAKIQVEDNDDLQLALANALKNNQELTLHVKTSKTGKPNFAKRGEKKVKRVRDPAEKESFKNLKALILKELEGKTIAGFAEVKAKSPKSTPQQREEIKQDKAKKSAAEGFDYTQFIQNKDQNRERRPKKFRVNKNVVNEFGLKMLEHSTGSQEQAWTQVFRDPQDMQRTFNEIDWTKVFSDEDYQSMGKKSSAKFEKRAIIMNKPENVFEVSAGNTFVYEIEVLNNTKKTWKQGSYISLDDEQTVDAMPIEALNFPIEKEVIGKAKETFEIPITVSNDARGGKVEEIFLTFRNHQGKTFGQRIPVKININ